MSLFAELDPDNRVQRVIVCDSPQWIAENLGGQWVAADVSAGPGMFHWEGAFFRPWELPVTVEDAYMTDDCCWYAGKPWESTVDHNTAIPGTVGWAEVTLAWYVRVYRSIKSAIGVA